MKLPVFCLLAVLLYISSRRRKECLDHQPLSQRTSLHGGDEDGNFFFFFYPSNVTLMEDRS